MIGYLTQNATNRMFEQWATADPNINQYGFGQLYNENGEAKVNQKYKGIWVNPVNTNVNEYTIDRTYQILIYDVVFDDDVSDNENRVISDCEEIALRLIRFLKTKSDIFDINGTTPVIQPFSDRWLDSVSGVIIDLTIEFNGESSNCNDPSYDFLITQNDI
jgi:hypothetical protein